MAAEPGVREGAMRGVPRALSARLRAVRLQDVGALVALILLCVVFAILTSRFATSENLTNVLRQVSINAIIGAGMTFVIITAGIDLSVGSLLSLGCVLVAGFLTKNHMPLLLAVLATLAAVSLVGLFTGVAVAKQGLQPFIVTLAVFASARGLAQVYTNGQVIPVENNDFLALGNNYIGPVPVPVVLAAVVLLIAHIVLSRMKFGRYVYAIGGNEEAARISGIPVARVKISVYVISAFVSAIAGIVTASRLLSGDPQAGVGTELDVIAAVVIGGTSLFGGVGRISGTIIGTLIIGVISNGLTILNVQSFWQDVVKGLVIYLAMTIDTQLRKRPAG
jgi:ribose/xylose/arabinose/galactoside ABC-type transport system permease subunit